MKLVNTTAFALIAAAFAVPASAQGNAAPATQPAQPKITPSKGAMKALQDLQQSVDKKDYASVPAKVAAAEAVATTKDDHYYIGKLQVQAALDANDKAGIASGIDKIAASGFLSPTNVAGLYVGLGGTYFNDKQYAQSAAAYQKAIAVDPRNPDAGRMLGEALFAGGQKAEAAAALQKAIQASIAAGQKPSEDVYRLAVQSAFDAKLPIADDLARQWVTSYPSADSWRNSIMVYRALNQVDDEGTLDLLRLMQAAGALKQANDYAMFASRSMGQNNYNEAQAVIDAGIAAKVVDPANPEFRDFITDLKKKPKATPADLATATKTAANGMALLRIGDRYYAMGDYAKAVELYRMSMGKPGVDKDVANLHVGMALARSGDKAGAVAAFNAVGGQRAEIAKLWLTYLSQKA